MNLLLTCVGRRNYLVRYFKEAFALLGIPGKVVVTDASANAPAMKEAETAIVVPSVAAEDYLPSLLEVCRKNDVRLIVSLNDLELPILAEARDDFRRQGIEILVSSPEVIRTCFDKWETYLFFNAHGIPSPKTFLSVREAMSAIDSGDLAFPLVVKPRWGSASIGINFVEDAEELRLIYALQSRRMRSTSLAGPSSADPEHCVIIQEALSSQEYGLDVINDLNGLHQAVVVKKKLAMRAGETDRATTVEAPPLKELGQRLGALLHHVGNLDCDVFWDGDRLAVLELNPRFGGGYPFSHAAGLNLPAAILAWASGLPLDPAWLTYSPDTFAAKYDNLMVF